MCFTLALFVARVKKIKRIIGRVERVNFPDWNILGIDAKIDTGAYTSSLHCHEIEKTGSGKKKSLTFKLLDPSHSRYNKQKLEFREFSESIVKNSFGQTEKRFKIKTKVTIGHTRYLTEFTLTDRSDMKYPVLLGRKVLNKRFLVDVSKAYLLTKKKKR